jgi:sensor domain CHASE-containing protein
MFSVEAITSKNLIIHYALIPILIGFSIVIITSVKLINKINIKLNKKIENHAKTKLIEGFVLLSIIIF